MTFEEWWEREDRVYLNEYSTFKMVAAQAWNHQQKRIEELEDELKSRQQKHLDSIRALRRANEQITTIAADNVALRRELESPQEPTEESAYFERIEELEEQVEWHKRRVDAWRSIAVLEAESE